MADPNLLDLIKSQLTETLPGLELDNPNSSESSTLEVEQDSYINDVGQLVRRPKAILGSEGLDLKE